MPRKLRTYRISDEAFAAIADLAKKAGVSQGRWIELQTEVFPTLSHKWKPGKPQSFFSDDPQSRKFFAKFKPSRNHVRQKR